MTPQEQHEYINRIAQQSDDLPEHERRIVERLRETDRQLSGAKQKVSELDRELTFAREGVLRLVGQLDSLIAVLAEEEQLRQQKGTTET